MSFDESLFRAINGLAGQSAWLDQWALNFSNPGLLWAPCLLMTGYWLWLSWREAVMAAPVLAASVGLLDFIGARLKDLVARPRPCRALPDIHQIEACGKTFGFPSNHAINSATAAAFLQMLYPRSGWVSWPLVGLIGLSRVYIGAHYVTDVLGGWMIGGLLGAGSAWLLLRYSHFRISPKRLPA
ncbi:MAG: phosphatase PAP2 family protein [Nitrospira sp.]|nr:phosphatase PAP2 family protein [Nitrospira sp.]